MLSFSREHSHSAHENEIWTVRFSTSLYNLELSCHTRAQLLCKTKMDTEAKQRLETQTSCKRSPSLSHNDCPRTFPHHYTQLVLPLASALTTSCTCYAKNGSFAHDSDQLETR